MSVEDHGGHDGAIMCLAVFNGKVWSGSKDGTLRLWDMNGKCERKFLGHEGWVLCLAVYQDTGVDLLVLAIITCLSMNGCAP